MASPVARIQSLFEQALSLPAPERRRFVDTIEPADLRAEVADLLERGDAGDALAVDLEGAISRAADALFGNVQDSHVGNQIGRFEVRSVLGDGSHARVYLAFDPELQREVAVKVLRAVAGASVDRFMTEARTISALEHPHIGIVHEMGETPEGEHYIVMPRYAGRTLAEALKEGPLPASKSVEITVQLAAALRTAHAAGIVHRDVKAANVIFESDNSVRLLDFGIAKLAQAHQTEVGVVLGTVAYMSPEQTRGSDVDLRTDVWSLGVLLHEMLTGSKPFEGDEAEAVIHQIRHDEPARVASLPRGLRRIVGRALAKDPDQRFGSMDELLDALRRRDMAGGHDPGNLIPVPRLAGSTQAHRRTLAIATLLLVATAAGLYVLVDRVEPSNQIAVLPFENRSSDPADEVLSEEISAELREDLGSVGDLNVIARASSGAPQQEGLEPTAIASLLQAQWLVTGVLERTSGGIDLTVRVLNGVSGQPIWTQRYDSEGDDLMPIRQQVAQDVAASLAPATGAVDQPPASGVPVSSESAYSLMLVANNYIDRALHQEVVDQELLDEAIRIYRRAVAEDPTSPLLNSRLGAALLYSGDPDAAQAPIERARALGEHLSHVQHTLALYLYARHEDGVGKHLRRAVELNPNNVDALEDYGFYLYAQADIAGARLHLERALLLDPMSIQRYEALGNLYGTSGVFEGLLELARQIPQTFDTAAAYLATSRLYELAGDLDEAIAWAAKARQRDPDHQAPYWRLAELYTRIGDMEAADRYDPEPSIAKLYFSRRYDEMIDLAFDLTLEDDSPTALFTLARAYTATDRYEEAIRLLGNQGLPERLWRDSATASDFEAGLNLADALNEAGRPDDAKRLVEYLTPMWERWFAQGPADWYSNAHMGCVLSLAGEDEESLDHLERLAKSRALPWYPIIKDQPCFRKRFAGNPRYEAVLETIVERKKRLRERLPDTLQRLGVADDPTTQPVAVSVLEEQ